MIDEVFLNSAINIRREYLKLSNNMELYHNKANEVVVKLEDIIKKIDEVLKDKQNTTQNESIEKLMKILTEVEAEGSTLEKLIEPINKEIEKLNKEENELFRQIKDKHKDISDEDIFNVVQNRLLKEGI